YLNERSVKLAEELKLFERDLFFVQPSRITPRKNIELSIHIVRGIKLAGYDILLLLTGAYDPHEKKAVSYYRRLKYWINNLGLSENIAILAEYVFKNGEKLVLDRILIRDLYLMADMLLMPSKDEGFGLPLLEAGMIKLPIACSQIPPFEEIGEDVCFFKLEDPPMIVAGKILEYLARTNTHKMFKKSVREYTLENICKKRMIPLLKEVIKNEKINERRNRASNSISSWKAY
ncbi:MAG: glycosyl transferase family 1, partial [Deltaproteobacteria bacterium]